MDTYYELREIKTDKLIGVYGDLEKVIKKRLVSQYIKRIDGMYKITMMERMIVLNDTLKFYNEHYYKHNESLIDDGTYDKLMKRLEEWERKYPQYKNDDSMANKVGSSL